MSNLKVTNFEGTLVVDSRLIAEELGIQHKSFKDTIRNYETDLNDFGQVRFETAVAKDSFGGNPETFCYLNEDQATFIMTLSRNTEQVVEAKKKLVKAFKSAKKIITKQETDLTVLFDVISEMQKNMNLLTERTQKLDAVTQEKLELEEKLEEIDDAGFNNPGAYSVIKADLEQMLDDNYITVDQYLTSVGIKVTDSTKLTTIRRRAAAFYRASKFKSPLKNKQNRTVYSGSEVEYIKSAIKSEIGYLLN